MHLISCTNTQHDVTDLVNHGDSYKIEDCHSLVITKKCKRKLGLINEEPWRLLVVCLKMNKVNIEWNYLKWSPKRDVRKDPGQGRNAWRWFIRNSPTHTQIENRHHNKYDDDKIPPKNHTENAEKLHVIFTIYVSSVNQWNLGNQQNYLDYRETIAKTKKYFDIFTRCFK